jgi:hypothetical protein
MKNIQNKQNHKSVASFDNVNDSIVNQLLG